MPGQNFLDDVSNDLALWIDETASDIALAFAPARAPFSAKVTEEAKLEYYRAKLFNPDGTPNAQGRAQEIQRLGAEGFGAVYKAVVARYPELKVAPPPPIEVPDQWPAAAPGPPPGGAGPGPMPPGPPGGPPGPPPGPPVPPMGPPQPPIMPRPMARGGIVTQPTVALIGEAGPEMVVPLSQYQLPDYDLQAHLGGEAVPQGDRDYSALDTPLSPADETQFQLWKAQYAPRDSGFDYDLRGAFQAGLTPDPQTGHWPDTFKKPNHPTFSNQSRYAQAYPNQAGSWQGDIYLPPVRR